MAAFREPALITDSANHAIFIWVNLMIVIAPYTALMALISLFAKSGMQAVNYAAILWILFFFVVYFLSNKFPEAQLLKSFFPGAQVSDLVGHHDWTALKTVPIPAFQTIVFLAAGLFFMHRIDL